MNIKSYIKIGLLSITTMGFFSSCSQDLMDDINANPNNPLDAQAKFILADALVNTAVRNIGGDINTYLSTYVEHYTGVHNQLFFAENRIAQPQSASTFNNTWNSLYRALRDSKLIVEKCSPGGSQEGNDVTLGIGQVLLAYNIGLLTDMFGDVPYSEALDWEGNKTPVLDKQEDLYAEILSLLTQAIDNLDGTDSHTTGGVGNYDLLYAGNKERWQKLAYGLRARYTLHKINRSTDVASDYVQILSDIDNSFTNATEEAAFNVYNAQNRNPLYDFQFSRLGLAGSRSFADKLIERNDPRLARYYATFDDSDPQAPEWVNLGNLQTSDDEYDNLPPNGDVPAQHQLTYTDALLLYAQTASTMFLSYHELLFIKAEVLQRSGGASADVEDALKDAIQAAVVNAENSLAATYSAPGLPYPIIPNSTAITTTEVDDYFNNEILPLLAVDPLKEIANQKYIAFLGASGETTEIYNDIRRWQANNEDFINLDNPGRFPLRLPYGNSETTTNPNVDAAYGDGSYVYSENVWWAGGTR